MMPRRSMTRVSGIRDASIICIACEGADTEPSYFNALKAKYIIPPSRIHLDIVEREDASLSAPDHIIAMLDREKRKNGRHPDDQYWIVIDYDRWGEQKLRQIAQKASQKQYMLAVSRPCFETWLLLHIVTEDELDSLALQISEAEDCKAVENMLRIKRRHYNKKLNDAAEYVDKVEHAIKHAKKLDAASSNRWPQSFGSRVYLLCEHIIEQKRHL